MSSSKRQLAGTFIGQKGDAFHPSSAGVELEGAFRFS